MRSDLRPDDLITGEAVVVAVPVAGPGIRAVSGVIDALTTLIGGGLLLWLILWAVAESGVELDAAVTAGLLILYTVALFVGLPVLLEATLGGRTLGKLTMGLRTVRDDGAPADLRRIITRHLVGYVEVWMTSGSVALWTYLLTQPTRRLGDMAAGTYVARDRIKLAMPPVPTTPPELAEWVHRADIGRLPDDLAALIRTSLAQGRQFTDAASERTARTLADRVLHFVAPPPPPGTTPRALLDAVMAERRRRESLRLDRLGERRRRLFGTAAPQPASTTPRSASASASASTPTSASASASTSKTPLTPA